MERRNFLRGAVFGTSAAVFGGTLMQGAAYAAPAQNGVSPYGGLLAADANGIMLPSGFTSRVIARSSQTVPGTSYTWHGAPDGGACFADGTGWIYVSNSELGTGGGASAVRFNSSGSITGAYRILSNTRTNCAGGATPWNTWLSCEEVSRGYVYETDPWGVKAAVRRDAMGRFKHEAAAADPVRKVIYLTEDESDGCFYRFIPTTWGDLSSGTLQVLVGKHRRLRLLHLDERPRPRRRPHLHPRSGLRRQDLQRRRRLPLRERYRLVHHQGRQPRLAAQPAQQHLRAGLRRQPGHQRHRSADRRGQRHRQLFRRPVRRRGRRQHGNLHHHPRRHRRPFLRVTGQSSSEICGPAFSPDGNRLYFSSQRGTSGSSSGGITYEVTGPFRTTA